MKNNTTTLDELKDKHFGKQGTVEREELETGYINFCLMEKDKRKVERKVLRLIEKARTTGKTIKIKSSARRRSSLHQII